MPSSASHANIANFALCVRWMSWRIAVAVLFVSLIMFGDCLLLWLFRDELAMHVAGRIQQQLPGLHVQLRSLERIEGYGVVLRGLLIRDPSRGRELGRILEVDEIRVRCATDLESLLSGHSHPNQVILRRPRLMLAGLDALLPLLDGPFTDSGQALNELDLPEIRVQDGQVALSDPIAGELRLEDIAASWTQSWPDDQENQSAPQWNLRLNYASKRLGDGQVIAGLRPEQGAWRVDARLQNLQMDEELWRSAGPWLMDGPADWKLSGQVDLQIAAGQTDSAARPWIQAQGSAKNGRLQAPDGETELREAEATFVADHAQWKLQSLSGWCKDGKITASGVRHGWSSNSPLSFEVQADNLDVTRPLIALLSADWRERWRCSQPLGRVDASLQINKTGDQWRTRTTFRCLDVSMKHDLFPYPLQGVHGLVVMDDDRTEVDLQSVVDGRVVHIESVYQEPLGKFADREPSWLKVRTDGLVSLSPSLISAFPAATQRVLTALQAHGKVGVAAHIEETPQGQTRQRIELAVSDGSIRFVDFPYPINDIEGRLVIDNDRCIVEKLSGRKGQAAIDCEGVWEPLAADGRCLRLRLDCRNVPLDDQLQQAMNADGQRVWDELRPSGSLRAMTLRVAYDPAKRDLQWDVTGQQSPEMEGQPKGRLALYPRRFPYALEDIRGRFAYADGLLRLEDVRATHGPTSLQVDGSWLASPESWRLDLKRFNARRIVVDRELSAALPKGLKTIVDRLQPTGGLSVDGKLILEGDRRRADIASQWDLKVDLEDATIQGGLPLEALRGAVRLTGSADNIGFRNRGELEIDSMMVRDVQVTSLRGPFWVDPKQVVLGSPPGPSPHAPPLYVTGKALGGDLITRGVVLTTPQWPFAMEAQLRDAELQQAALSIAPANRQVSGRLHGELRLQGNAYGAHTWHGGGSLHMRQADLYETPFMVKLLSLLQVRPQESKTFSTGDVDVRIEGEHLYLDRIELSSEAVTLRGQGEVSGQREVAANLYAAVRGQERIVGRVFHAASRQLLQIDVAGKLDDPRIHRRALPELNDTIHRLFPELARNNDQHQPPAPGPLRRLADAWNPDSRVAPAGGRQLK